MELINNGALSHVAVDSVVSTETAGLLDNFSEFQKVLNGVFQISRSTLTFDSVFWIMPLAYKIIRKNLLLLAICRLKGIPFLSRLPR
jgi:hypothetical protein